MFEKLGFEIEYQSEEEGCIAYEKTVESGKYQVFFETSGEYFASAVSKYSGSRLPLWIEKDLHKAINQQLKELGVKL